MKNLALFFLMGLLAIFTLIGCEKDSENPFTQEVQDEVELQQIASDEDEEYLFNRREPGRMLGSASSASLREKFFLFCFMRLRN